MPDNNLKNSKKTKLSFKCKVDHFLISKLPWCTSGILKLNSPDVVFSRILLPTLGFIVFY